MMIKVNYAGWAHFIYRIYIDRQLKNHFGRFLLTENPPLLPVNGVIVMPNHISWWDGFFIEYLQRKLFPERKFALMMLESELSKYKFFSRVGAFSIQPENPKAVVNSMRYAASLLSDKNAFVVIYPQGMIELQDKSELTVRFGISKMLSAEKERTAIPVFFRILYNNQKLPDIVCGFGTACTFSKENDTIPEKSFVSQWKIFKKKTESLYQNDSDKMLRNLFTD